MGTIKSVFQRVNNFYTSMDKITIDVIKDNSKLILDENRSQLFDGLDKEGKEIVNEQGGKYSPTTVRIKQEKGQPTDRVTLRDTGDWQDAMFLEVKGNEILTDSSDWKTDELLKKYDRNMNTILGIPETSKTKINSTLMDRLIFIFRQMTNL